MNTATPAPTMTATPEPGTASRGGGGLTLTAADFDVTKHNGEVTISNPETGGHRTFRVRTCLDGDLKGKRIVELLHGPDNESDYIGFAFADDFGVHVWRRLRALPGGKPTAWETYAKMLMSPKAWAEKRGVEYLVSARCRRCNRRLTRPGSIVSGYGPDCLEKVS